MAGNKAMQKAALRALKWQGGAKRWAELAQSGPPKMQAAEANRQAEIGGPSYCKAPGAVLCWAANKR